MSVVSPQNDQMSRRYEAELNLRRPSRAHWRPSEEGGPQHLYVQNLRGVYKEFKDDGRRRQDLGTEIVFTYEF